MADTPRPGTGAFWVNREYDEDRASDGRSRFGSYLRDNLKTLAGVGRGDDAWACSDDERRVLFAVEAWRIATPPVMAPGFVRRHPRITGLRLFRDDWDGSLAAVAAIATPLPDVLGLREIRPPYSWWRTWPLQDAIGSSYRPPGGEEVHEAPHMLASVAIHVRLLGPADLPVAPPADHTAVEAAARRAVDDITRALNHALNPVIASLGEEDQ